MAAKRTAASDLNHDNWDDDEEKEEAGSFRTASKEELSRRVIRTGRRRVPLGGAPQDSSIFSTFSGFNKPAPSSFDFLSNLTNGTASSNGSAVLKKEDSTNKFVIPPTSSSTTIGSTLNDATKPVMATNTGSVFGITNVTTSTNAIFTQTSSSSNENKPTFTFGSSSSTTSKPPMMFVMPTKSSKESTNSFESPPKTPVLTFGIPTKSQPTIDAKTTSKFEPGSLPDLKTPMTFGMLPTNSANTSNSIFGIPTKSSTPMATFKLPTTSTPAVFNTGSKSVDTAQSFKKTTSNAIEENSTTETTQYYSKLKGLNESVSEWIRKHVNENPLCILTPIFKDYEKYLKDLEQERSKSDTVLTNVNVKHTENMKEHTASKLSTASSIFASNVGLQANANSSIPKSTGFVVTSSTAASLFSFGTTAATPNVTSTPTPFSFGTGGNFNALQKPQEQSDEQKDEDEPPKVEYNPISEENSVFDKKCKIFFKKEGEFVDKGVGTLYIKTVPNSNKHQIIVRANTSLGTIFVNFILSDSIPAQRMGKNNVMVVCIPTPDSQPPPIPVLIRVKTSEEADGLLETINKYKN